MQRLVGKTIRRVAASHVRVHAREPGLLELSGPAGWSRPDIGRKRLPPLINRERMKRILDRRIETDVVILVLTLVEELSEGARRAERTYRIPHTDESDCRTWLRSFHMVKGFYPLG